MGFDWQSPFDSTAPCIEDGWRRLRRLHMATTSNHCVATDSGRASEPRKGLGSKTPWPSAAAAVVAMTCQSFAGGTRKGVRLLHPSPMSWPLRYWAPTDTDPSVALSWRRAPAADCLSCLDSPFLSFPECAVGCFQEGSVIGSCCCDANAPPGKAYRACCSYTESSVKCFIHSHPA